jgi:hypothetical protein
MANSKRFVVKNGLETQNIQFVTADGTEKIIATVLEDGTLSFSGTSGQLFSIVDSLTGSIFSVNDISGIPSIEVFDDGKVILAESTGNVGIGTITPTEKLTVSGNVSATRLISTQATGTAPFTVTSTTKVDNLNADLLNGYSSDSFYSSTNPAGYTTNTGTVTAVTGTSPVASSGGTAPDISLASGYGDTQNPYGTKNVNTVLAGPGSGTTAAVPTFRALVAADIPTLNQNTTGTSAGVVRTVTGTTSAELVRGNMADNDQARILVGGTATNAGFLEIATADDGTEPIHVRQYTGAFATLTRTATILDGSGNTSFPGTITGTRLISNIANGTAPLAVTSTTAVANLNADLLDGNHASAFALSSHTHAISDVTNLQTELDGKIDESREGQPSGIATLDSSGTLTASQIPYWVGSGMRYLGAVNVTDTQTNTLSKIIAYFGSFFDYSLDERQSTGSYFVVTTGGALTQGAAVSGASVWSGVWGTASYDDGLSPTGTGDAKSLTVETGDFLIVTNMFKTAPSNVQITFDVINNTYGAATTTANGVVTLSSQNTYANLSGNNVVTDGVLKTVIDNAAFALSSHTHAIADVSNLQTSLDAKANLSGATFTGAVNIQGNKLNVGDVSGDDYIEISQYTGSNAYGFTTEFDNASTISNQQGGTNQFLVLGDNSTTSTTGTLLGVSILQSGTYTPRLDLKGNGDLSFSGTLTGGTVPFARLTGAAAASHTHAIADVTGLQTALDGKLSTSGKAADSFNADKADFVDSFDTRNIVTTPETHSKRIRFDFKANSANDLSDGGSYNGVMYWRKYGGTTDWSGGGAMEIAYTDNGNLWKRYGTDTTWGSWNKLFADDYHPNADTLTTARNINGVSFDGSSNITITAEPTAHSHAIADVTGLQTALDGKLGTGAKAADSNLLDGLDSTAFLRSNADSTLTTTLFVDSTQGGSIAYVDNGGTYIPRPSNASYKTDTNVVTGALTVRLPGAIPADMMSFWIDVYDYAGNPEGESLSIYVYGYAYSTSSPFWTNVGALILSDRTDRDYNVRFGYDGTNHTVSVGETSSIWNYPQVIVRDFQAGYTASPSTFDDGWSITFLTTLPTIGQTASNNYPVAKNSNLLDGIDSLQFLRSDTPDTIAATAAGPILTVSKTGSAPGNATPFLSYNEYGNHSWGIAGEFRNGSISGSDRPSILFSTEHNTNTWSVGYGFTDDNFRIKQDHGYRNTGWGTTRFSLNRTGAAYLGELTNRIFADDYHPNADVWTTARTITIGNTGKSVDGGANVGWTLAEIGAQAAGTYLTAEADTLATVTGRGATTTTNIGTGKISVSAAMTNGSTSAFTSPHLALKATDTVDTTGFVGMTFATSSVDNHGFSLGALRSTAGSGSLVARFHLNSISGTELLRLTPEGNVGIGTIAPTAKLHVVGDTILDGNLTVTNIISADDSQVVINPSSYVSISTYGMEGVSPFIQLSSDEIILNTDDVTRMRILSDGNIGIGTDTPAVKLDVVGQVAISTGTYPSLSVETTSTQTNLQATSAIFNTTTTLDMADGFGSGIAFTIEDDANVINSIGFIGAVRAGADNSGSLTFSTNNAGTSSRKMTILPDGNVGIGTTSPYSKLDVGTPLGNDGLLTISGRYDLGGTSINFRSGHGANANVWDMARIHITDDGNYNGRIEFRTSTDGQEAPTTKMVIKHDGNVGIGTASPVAKLAVEGAAYFANDIYLRDGATASGDILVRIYDSSDDGVIDVYRNNSVLNRIHGNGPSFFNAGNVGIGTATPSAKLDVVGDVKHTGLTMTSGTNVDQLKETTFTSALTTAWTDVTGVSGTYLETGSYIVQIISNGEYYTGNMTWFSGTTTSTVVDEIVLHRAGPAASAGRIFARVIRTSSAPSTLKLQVSGSASISSHAMTFKFRRTI